MRENDIDYEEFKRAYPLFFDFAKPKVSRLF